MRAAPLLDTHAWIWWLTGDARLGRNTLRRLDQLPHDSRPALCDISLWEIAMLVHRRRLELPIAFDAWLETAAAPQTVRILPVNAQIAGELSRLPESWQNDPADRLIVSTSRVHGLRVLTRDQRIAESGLVRLW